MNKVSSRRNFLRWTGGLLAGLALCDCVEAGQQAAFSRKKPNILFLLSDDQCFQAFRAAGNMEIETPNLDRLAARSVQFTHAYNQGAWHGAVCVASRAMLNTGRYLWAAKTAAENKKDPTYQDALWSELIRDAGYKSYFSGKWHVSKKKPPQVFDVAQHVRGGMPSQTKTRYDRPLDGREDDWKPWKKEFGGFWAGGKHWSEVLGDDGIDFLDDAAKQDKPFFMYLAFNAPHDPRQSPKEFVDKYPLDKISTPENYMPEYPHNEAMGSGRKLRDERLAPFPRTEYAVKVNRQEYYAIVTHMDQQIGRILDKLEALGLDKETYIIFTSDHGLAVGKHGLLGKQNMYDHSVRVPLTISGPDIPKGVKTDKKIYLQDVMPTTLELAGAEKPDYVQFQSLLPIIKSNFSQGGNDYIYGAYKNQQRMVTDGQYKLILYPTIKKALIFDLRNDPEEMKDLFETPVHKNTAKRLFKELQKLQQETKDELDLVPIYPDLAQSHKH